MWGYSAFVFFLAIPLFLLLGVSDLQFNIAMTIVFIVIIFSSYRLSKFFSSPKHQIVTSTFWVFVYIFLGVSPFIQLGSDRFPWPGYYDEALIAKSALVVLVGLFAFDFGAHQYSSRGLAIPKLLKRPLNKSAIYLVSISALVSVPFFLQRLGGIDILFMPRLERTRILMLAYDLPEILLLSNFLSTPVYVALIAVLVKWFSLKRKNMKMTLGWKLLIFILFLFTIILNNPISNPRLRVGTILLSFFFVLPWRRWSSRVMVGGLVVGMLVVFPFTDLFRVGLDVSLIGRLEESSVVRELTENGDYDAFQMVANTVAFTENAGYQVGQQLVGAGLFWVPRAIWPSKPIPTGQMIGEQVGYGFTNLSAPLWAEFYIDGGFILVILGFFGYGYLVRTLDSWYAYSCSQSASWVLSIMVPIYAGYQFFLLRGALMPAIAYFAPMLLVALICSIPLSGKASARILNDRARITGQHLP
tara:strand:- start:10071 stop:11486 length:1416 start_codon:yes stop_codon:yes gene_type:complete